MPIAARAVGLTLGYEGTTALGASTFTIPAAKLTAVIGPNGSGKSTLLSALAGLIEPRSGVIEVFGGSPRRSRARIAYVLQSTKVNEVMPITVGDVVAMGRYGTLGPLRRFGEADRISVEAAMDRLEIEDLADRHLTELSGGQRHRAFVAQGLAQEADLLLLDEPVTGLDLVSRQLIMQALAEELGAGHTVVLTTHDLGEAGEADHVLLLGGRVLAEGAPASVLSPDSLSDAYEVSILHLEDGSFVLDDPHHRGGQRHVHFERGHGHRPDEPGRRPRSRRGR